MIDVSDGLLSDLWQICRASNRGFKIDRDKIPLSKDLKDYSGEKNIIEIELKVKTDSDSERSVSLSSESDILKGLLPDL